MYVIIRALDSAATAVGQEDMYYMPSVLSSISLSLHAFNIRMGGSDMPSPVPYADSTPDLPESYQREVLNMAR